MGNGGGDVSWWLGESEEEVGGLRVVGFGVVYSTISSSSLATSSPSPPALSPDFPAALFFKIASFTLLISCLYFSEKTFSLIDMVCLKISL